jgi:hypothetical protein
MRLPALAFVLSAATADVHGQDSKLVTPRQDPLHRQNQFHRLDGDGDRMLTVTEFASHPGAFQAMDCDADLVLVESEYVVPYRCSERAVNAASFTPSDWNGTDAPASGVLHAAARSFGGRAGASLRDDGLSEVPTFDDETLFDDLDRNADGRLTISEWTSSQASFMRLDANRDGALARSEHGSLRGFRRTPAVRETSAAAPRLEAPSADVALRAAGSREADPPRAP